MTFQPPKRRGRPEKFVTDFNGQKIVGLSYHKHKNLYYATFSKKETGKVKYFSSDLAESVAEFHQWEADLLGKTITLKHRRPANADELRAIKTAFVTDAQKRGKLPLGKEPTAPHRPIHVTKHYDVPDSSFWQMVRHYLITDLNLVAKETGYTDILRLKSLPSPMKDYSLVDAGKAWVEDKRADSQNGKNIKNVEKWWQEFVDCVEVKTVNDLNHDIFRKYATKIKTQQKEISEKTGKPRGPAYTRNRFNAIKTILNYAATIRKISPELLTKLKADWKQPLKSPKIPAGDKCLLSHEELQALLDNSDDTMKAYILLSLNSALYPADVDIEWKHVNLDDGTLCYRRTKKDLGGQIGTPRVAVLWQETIDALKALPRLNQYIFATEKGSPPAESTVWWRLSELQKKVDLERVLSPEDLRNSAATISSRSAPQFEYKVIMGHALAAEDAGYIEGNPWYVANACAAIGKHYGFTVIDRAYTTPQSTPKKETKPRPKPKTKKTRTKKHKGAT